MDGSRIRVLPGRPDRAFGLASSKPNRCSALGQVVAVKRRLARAPTDPTIGREVASD